MFDLTLKLFGGESAPNGFLELVGTVSAVTEAQLDATIPSLFDSDIGPLGIDSDQQNELELELANAGIDSDTQDGLLSFLRIVCRQSAKFDLSESDLRDDFREVNLDVTKWEDTIEAVHSTNDTLRSVFSQQSRLTGIPRLQEVRWKVSTDRATGLVHGIDMGAITVSLGLYDPLEDEQRTVAFEVPEEERGQLDALISELSEAREML